MHRIKSLALDGQLSFNKMRKVLWGGSSTTTVLPLLIMVLNYIYMLLMTNTSKEKIFLPALTNKNNGLHRRQY